jgi:hypothetical protein
MLQHRKLRKHTTTGSESKELSLEIKTRTRLIKELEHARAVRMGGIRKEFPSIIDGSCHKLINTHHLLLCSSSFSASLPLSLSLYIYI